MQVQKYSNIKKSYTSGGKKEQHNDINLSHENNPTRSPVKESDYFTMYVQIFKQDSIIHNVNRVVIMITM